ncbi:protein S40-4-like [Rutidosis leptorrhynchoides]|uniref:protein S40-4-like n=1 Tax=Rutidosis leptorrhynchoides TaxID=125765 RepID=UPI003A99FB90
MAASRTYFGRGNHRYLSSAKEIIQAPSLTFEFNEFDVWNVTSSPEFHKSIKTSRISKKQSPETENRVTALSLPVDVPDWSMILKQELTANRSAVSHGDSDDFDDDLFSDDLIPPHEYLAKARIASFSVHEGIGRTLKGRDLSRVRNALNNMFNYGVLDVLTRIICYCECNLQFLMNFVSDVTLFRFVLENGYDN